MKPERQEQSPLMPYSAGNWERRGHVWKDMRAVDLQTLKCETCSGPLPWDGEPCVLKCPQCSTPHAIRWNRSLGAPAAGPVVTVAAQPIAPPTPQDQLRRLEAAWHRTDAQFFEHHKQAWRGIRNLLVGLALCGFLLIVLGDDPRWGVFTSFGTWFGVGWTVFALLWYSGQRRRAAERKLAHQLYQAQKNRLTAQMAASVGHR